VVKLNCIVLLGTEIKILNYWTISPVRHMGQQVDSLKDAKFVCQRYTLSSKFTWCRTRTNIKNLKSVSLKIYILH